jgi:hypothetical protein
MKVIFIRPSRKSGSTTPSHITSVAPLRLLLTTIPTAHAAATAATATAARTATACDAKLLDDAFQPALAPPAGDAAALACTPVAAEPAAF